MTSEKAYAVEGRLNRLVGEGWAVPLVSWKPSDEPRSNNTTVAQDTDLTITLPATPESTRFEVYALLGYTGAAGSGNFKWSFNPAGGTMRYSAKYADASLLDHFDWQRGGTAYIAGTNGVTTELAVEIARGWVTVPATPTGDFWLQWAQGTSSATATTLLAGSFVGLRKIDG